MPPGRPKRTTGDPSAWDVRITPSNGEPIAFDNSLRKDDYDIFLACREGGPTTAKKLHYHCYIVSRLSETSIRNMCSFLANGTGNPAYSVRKAHEGTIGYVVKEGDVVFRHGCSNEFITEWLSKSKDYRKDLEAQRRAASRAKENTLAEILKVVAEGVSSSTSPSEVSDMILEHYYQKELKFPTRSVVEQAVMTLLYPHQPTLVRAFYAKNFLSQY